MLVSSRLTADCNADRKLILPAAFLRQISSAKSKKPTSELEVGFSLRRNSCDYFAAAARPRYQRIVRRRPSWKFTLGS
jgi:hypothetical protein